jgi:SSS family solute:Na+ symporter
VLAGLFAHTMAMTSSDANAVAAVIVRDIVPVLRGKRAKLKDATQLLLGRLTTFSFLSLSMVLALFASHFGGVIGIVILWYGALVGPIAIPMLLGLLLPFRRCGPAAAIASWIAGAVMFGLLKAVPYDRWLGLEHNYDNALAVGAPMLASLLTYLTVGLMAPSRRTASYQFLLELQTERSPATQNYDTDIKSTFEKVQTS